MKRRRAKGHLEKSIESLEVGSDALVLLHFVRQLRTPHSRRSRCKYRPASFLLIGSHGVGARSTVDRDTGQIFVVRHWRKKTHERESRGERMSIRLAPDDRQLLAWGPYCAQRGSNPDQCAIERSARPPNTLTRRAATPVSPNDPARKARDTPGGKRRPARPLTWPCSPYPPCTRRSPC
jgi:hypothetical protein